MRQVSPSGRGRRRGSSLLEFALVGIPIMLLPTAILFVALDMWQYHTLAYSTQSTARYVSLHGRDCTENGSSCTVSIGDVATYFAAHAVALDPSNTKVILTSATQTITCNPVNTCVGNAAQFPNANDNGVNFDVTVTAYYTVMNPARLIPGVSSAGPSAFTLFATTRQRITY